MGYCIMKIKKIKSKASMTMIYQHNYRTVDVPNADPDMIDLNEELVKLHGQTYVEAFEDRIKSLPYYETRKLRKDAVMALEVVTTFSKAKNIDVEEWKKKNVEWLKDTFNKASDADNIVSIMYHGDEVGNIHCHAFVIPIDEKGHLSSYSYIGKPRKLVEMQNSYGEKMKEFGLKRGLYKSVAKHEDIKRFYTALNQETVKELPPVQKKGLLKETAEEYRERANEVFKTSNLQHLGQIKDMERKVVEARTYNLQDVISSKSIETDYQKRIKTLEKKTADIDELERTHGSVKTIVAKLEAFDTLIKGASDYAKTFPEDQRDIQVMKKTMDKVLKYKKKKDAERLAEETKAKELAKQNDTKKNNGQETDDLFKSLR